MSTFATVLIFSTFPLWTTVSQQDYAKLVNLERTIIKMHLGPWCNGINEKLRPERKGMKVVGLQGLVIGRFWHAWVSLQYLETNPNSGKKGKWCICDRMNLLRYTYICGEKLIFHCSTLLYDQNVCSYQNIRERMTAQRPKGSKRGSWAFSWLCLIAQVMRPKTWRTVKGTRALTIKDRPKCLVQVAHRPAALRRTSLGICRAPWSYVGYRWSPRSLRVGDVKSWEFLFGTQLSIEFSCRKP